MYGVDPGARPGEERSRAPSERAEGEVRPDREARQRAARHRRKEAPGRDSIPQAHQPATQGIFSFFIQFMDI